MTGLRKPLRSPSPPTFLLEARNLAEWVREKVEGLHLEAQESHRLVKIAKGHSERGRLLAELGRQDAQAIGVSIRQSLDVINKAGRRLSGKEWG